MDGLHLGGQLAGRPWADFEYRDSATSGSDLDEHTIADMAIGPLCRDRTVMVLVSSRLAYGHDGVTVGGEALGQVGTDAAYAGLRVSIWAGKVPNWITADVVVSLADASDEIAVFVFSGSGVGLTAYSSDTDGDNNSTPLNTNIDIPEGGCAVVVFAHNDVSTNTTFSGLTERDEGGIGTPTALRYGCAGDSKMSVESLRDVDISTDGGSGVLLSKSFEVGG